ncbi:MAG: DUF5565 family protein, partial [Myxococcota bacterium]
MKKTPSLFKRDYAGTRLVHNEIVEGSAWVLAGEGQATLKVDGTCCKVERGRLFKRYDRKLNRAASRRRRRGSRGPWRPDDFKPALQTWAPCEPSPNLHTGHWPGWLPVGDGPEDRWHREAFENMHLDEGTYELVGPKIQGNPYDLDVHQLWPHGEVLNDVPRDFEGLRTWFAQHHVEGVVWHHP